MSRFKGAYLYGDVIYESKYYEIILGQESEVDEFSSYLIRNKLTGVAEGSLRVLHAALTTVRELDDLMQKELDLLEPTEKEKQKNPSVDDILNNL